MTHLHVLATLLVSASVASIATAQLDKVVPQPGPVHFGSSSVGTPVKQTVTFQAATPITVAVSVLTNGAPNLDYAIGSSTCTGAIIPPHSCSVTVLFTPTQVGGRNGALLVTDAAHNVVARTFLHGTGTGPSFAVSPTSFTALATATGLSPATFLASSSVYDGSGNLYFTDIHNGRVLERTSAGVFRSIATLPVTASSSIVIAGDGTLYVSAQGSVYGILPGSAPAAINTPGVTLVNPTGLAVDGGGALFIADSANGNIARYSLTGSGATLIAVTGITPLTNPTGLAVDDAQNLYIADSGNNRIIKLSPDKPTPASVITFPGFTFNDPHGIVIDAAGTIYVTDTGNARIVEYTAQYAAQYATQYVSPVAFALTDKQLALTSPTGINLNPNGDLVVSDNALGLAFITRSGPSIHFPTSTAIGTFDTTDGPVGLTVQSTGNIASELFLPATGSNPSISSAAFHFGSGATCPTVSAGSSTVNLFAAGQVCHYPIDFQPTQPGLNTENLIFSAGPQGATTPAYTLTVPLSGMGVNATSITLSGTPNPILINTPTANLRAVISYSGVAPTGTVTFIDNTTGLTLGQPVTLTAASAGVAQLLNVRFGLLGDHNLVARYSGDGNYAPATSNTFVQDVVDPTTVVLNTAPNNPSLVGQSIPITATITSAAPAISGTVQFFDGGAFIGSANVSGTKAVLNYAFTTAGIHTPTCVYSGDVDNQTSFCTPYSQIVENRPTLTLSSGTNPSAVNQNVLFTATVTATGPAPTGTISFTNNGTVLCKAVPMANGQAQCGHTFTAPGTYPVLATYSGDANYTTATSNTVNQLVLNIATIVLNSTTDPLFVNNPDVLTVVATSTGTTPTGTVSFYDGNAPVGNAVLAGGTASLTVTFAGFGMHSLTALYAGDAVTAPAVSNLVIEDVADYSLTVASGTPSSATTIAGGTASFGLVLTPLYASLLPDDVTFTLDGMPKGMTAAFSPSAVGPGTGSLPHSPGSGVPLTLTLTAPPLTGHLQGAPQKPHHRGPAPAVFALLLLPLVLLRPRKKLHAMLLLLLMAAGFNGLTGCITDSNSGYYGQTTQTYNLTVSANSGNLSRTTNVTLIVQ
jgi:sugar lactone lactonase YvrE